MRANRRDVMAGGMLLAAAGFTKAVQAQQVPAPKSPADTGPQGPQGVPGTSGGGGAGGGLPVINVKADFGAVGDESHDDTAAIQNAVFKALRSKGGTVYFPVGKYKITSSIKFYLTPTSVAKSPNNKMRVAANIAALGLQTGDSAKVYLGK